MPGVLIIGDIADGGLSPASARLATAGAKLARALGEPLTGALIGTGTRRAADEFTYGLERLYIVDGAQYRPYTADTYIAAAQKLIETAKPKITLFAHGAETREWVPRLAARLGAGLVMDAADVAIEDDALIITKPVNGGGVLAEYVVRGSLRMATVRTSGFEPSESKGAPERLTLEAPPAPNTHVTVLSEEGAATSAGPRLKDAKIIVSGGRGIGGPDNWHFIEETSAALGAAIGCSRPVADSGWVPSSHQVGLSGTSVAPDLYIAVGISGAAQHLAGITAARKVVAINNSPDADIFTRADYGVVGDYKEVLPAFVQRVKQLRQES
jgi:electron transfer flavoprotein alpha subunit